MKSLEKLSYFTRLLKLFRYVVVRGENNEKEKARYPPMLANDI